MNSELYIRECELKYEIVDDSEQIKYISILKDRGFKLESDVLETDYVPDVEGFLCRKNGLMLRFRVMQGTTKDVLLTLKIKGKASSFQENMEIECLNSDFDKTKFKEINYILYNATGITITRNILDYKDIYDIILKLKSIGFSQHRMYLQKKRKEFLKGNIKVTFDIFPEPVGRYMEIETSTPDELFSFVDSIGIKRDRLIKEDYGQIIKEKQKGLTLEEQRTCLF